MPQDVLVPPRAPSRAHDRATNLFSREASSIDDTCEHSDWTERALDSIRLHAVHFMGVDTKPDSGGAFIYGALPPPPSDPSTLPQSLSPGGMTLSWTESPECAWNEKTALLFAESIIEHPEHGAIFQPVSTDGAAHLAQDAPRFIQDAPRLVRWISDQFLVFARRLYPIYFEQIASIRPQELARKRTKSSRAHRRNTLHHARLFVTRYYAKPLWTVLVEKLGPSGHSSDEECDPVKTERQRRYFILDKTWRDEDLVAFLHVLDELYRIYERQHGASDLLREQHIRTGAIETVVSVSSQCCVATGSPPDQFNGAREAEASANPASAIELSRNADDENAMKVAQVGRPKPAPEVRVRTFASASATTPAIPGMPQPEAFTHEIIQMLKVNIMALEDVLVVDASEKSQPLSSAASTGKDEVALVSMPQPPLFLPQLHALAAARVAPEGCIARPARPLEAIEANPDAAQLAIMESHIYDLTQRAGRKQWPQSEQPFLPEMFMPALESAAAKLHCTSSRPSSLVGCERSHPAEGQQ
ncbi:hypothetical protein AURDEDRAFT_128944 [Auricularia subglabra TFB-10046 SS5]|nr:hypothetical protein AURDEDRAFT_128944 [Auricularia subglabra TFB-10046 SS5]